MLNDCRQQQQKVFKEALLEVSKGQGLHHSCQEWPRADLFSSRGAGKGGMGFHCVLLPECSNRSSRSLWHPEPPCTNHAQTISAHPAVPGCELGLWHTWAHLTMVPATCSQAKDHGTALPTARNRFTSMASGPSWLKAVPEEPWAHCISLLQFTLIFAALSRGTAAQHTGTCLPNISRVLSHATVCTSLHKTKSHPHGKPAPSIPGQFQSNWKQETGLSSFPVWGPGCQEVRLATAAYSWKPVRIWGFIVKCPKNLVFKGNF